VNVVQRLWRRLPPGINPIVVKELRQAVRSRFVAGLLLFFLAVELFGIGTMLMFRGARRGSNLYLGRDMFQMLFFMLSVACVCFVPLYAGIRMGLERWDNNLDLLFITTIKPRAIIRGKLFAANAITLLLFAAAAPFMSFSYLLRGVDLPSVFIALGLVLVYVVGATQLALFLACLPTGRVFKIVLALVAVGGAFMATFSMNAVGWGLVRAGVGSRSRSLDFWLVAVSTLGGLWLGVGMLQRLSEALIRPPSANRALPVRGYATMVWLVAGIWTFVLAAVKSEPEILIGWVTPSLLWLSVAVLAGLSEETRLSARVRRTIPTRRPLRLLAFFFYNGPAGALCWVLLLAAATVTLTMGGGLWVGSHGLDGDLASATQGFASFLLYIVAYGLTAVVIWRRLFARRFQSTMIWFIAVVLVLLGALLPALAALLFDNHSSRDAVAWYMGNVFTVFARHYRSAHLVFAAFWAAVMLVVNARWLLRQMRDFVPSPANTP
jgi:hypothetical protein